MVWLQGEQLALRIYLDAVASDRFTWRIPGIPVPSGAEGMPQPALAPVGPQAAPSRPPSPAFRNQSHASHGAYSQHGSTPASVQGNSHRGRALEPQGPSNSPDLSQHISSSGRPRFSERPNPSTARVGSLQTGLLSHPSTSLTVDEEEPSLAQRLSQSMHRSQAYSDPRPYSDLQPFSHSASQGVQCRGATVAQPGSEWGSQLGSQMGAGKQPFAEQRQSAKRPREEILKVMEFTECSYKKARKVCCQPQPGMCLVALCDLLVVVRVHRRLKGLMCLRAKEHSLICFWPMEYAWLSQCEPLHVSNPAPNCMSLVAKWCPVYLCVLSCPAGLVSRCASFTTCRTQCCRWKHQYSSPADRRLTCSQHT